MASKLSHSPPFLTFISSSSGSISSFSPGDILGSTVILKFVTISNAAAFNCNKANLMPRQIRGPSPKGTRTPLSLKAFTPPCSALNRSGRKASGSWKNSAHEEHQINKMFANNASVLTCVVVKRQQRYKDSHSLLNRHFMTFDSINLDRFGANAIAKSQRRIHAKRFVYDFIQVRKIHQLFICKSARVTSCTFKFFAQLTLNIRIFRQLKINEK